MTDQRPLPTRPRPQPGIEDIVLYKGGESRLPGHDRVLKLSSNENPLGPPPSAVEAARRAAATLHLYPSTDHAELRAAIEEVVGLPADQVICGVGSDEVLTLLCQAYTGAGDEVIYTRHGFSLYPILARSAGATPVCIDETDRVVDIDKILAAITPRTKLIFVTNPGNPTGTLLPEGDMARLAASVPPHVVLVVDGAYAEYADGYDGGAGLVARHENVVMTRTFSKLYGLGGLRIGYGYAPRPMIDTLNRIRGPFNLSTVQLAAAEAALRDRDWADRCTALNARMRDWLRDQLVALGAEVDPSLANFLLARFGSEDAAHAADTALRADGILVRRVAGYGFPDALRITVGDEAGCRRVIAAIKRGRT